MNEYDDRIDAIHIRNKVGVQTDIMDGLQSDACIHIGINIRIPIHIYTRTYALVTWFTWTNKISYKIVDKIYEKQKQRKQRARNI